MVLSFIFERWLHCTYYKWMGRYDFAHLSWLFLEMELKFLYVHVEDHYLIDLLLITQFSSKWRLAPSYKTGAVCLRTGHGMVVVLAGGSLGN